MNKSFNYNDCKIDIRFTPADKYGVDRHTITIYKAMCSPLRAQSFKKTDKEIEEEAKEYTVFQTCTCG